MARCGCASSSCSCVVTGAGGVVVSGSGSAENPYVINGANFGVLDSPTVDLTLSGDGTILNPFKISAAANLTLDQLADVNATAPTAGYVLTYVTSPVAEWRAAVPQSGIPGATLHDSTLIGDGTPSSALGVKIDPAGGITSGVNGLRTTDSVTLCTSTTRPPAPVTYQHILETDTQAHGYWMPSGGTNVGDRWRMFDTRMQPYLAKIRSDWAGTTVGTGGYERGWYMRAGQLVTAVFTIYLGGPGSNMGFGPITVDLPFQAAGGSQGINNDMHGNSGYLQATGWAAFALTPAIQPGSTKAYFWVAQNPAASNLGLMQSEPNGNPGPGKGTPLRPGAWPIQDGSWIEGTFSYFTV